MSDLTRLQADVEFMKNLAVEGGEVPLNSGAPLFLAGLIFGLAALVHFVAAVSGNFAPMTSGVIWGGAMLSYVLALFGFALLPGWILLQKEKAA